MRRGAFAAPGIRLRNAVALDHQGDTDGCLRVLRDIDAELARFVRTGADARLRPSSRAAYGYARPGGPRSASPTERRRGRAAGQRRRQRPRPRPAPARRGVPGHRRRPAGRGAGPARRGPVSAETSARPSRPGCAASPRPGRRPRRRAPRRPARVPAGRPAQRPAAGRLRGRHRRPDRRTRRLRREAARYEGEALTDPLTGLPNRRQLERYVAAMVARGERAAIGVCDLDGFKAVNTRTGTTPATWCCSGSPG